MHVNQLKDFQVQRFFFNSMYKLTKPELDARMLLIEQVGRVYRESKACYFFLMSEIVRYRLFLCNFIVM
jgi:hypothetical protein